LGLGRLHHPGFETLPPASPNFARFLSEVAEKT
jgi:hypothetical protein